MEAPEIVRVAAPVYFKNSKSGPGVGVEDKLLQSICLVELIGKQYPQAKQTKAGAKDLCIPAKPGTKW